MANGLKTYRELSLAQVERELLSAEAYLAASAGKPYSVSKTSRKDETTGLTPDDTSSRWGSHGRPFLSEERRREILAKLSSERKSALQKLRVAPINGVEAELQSWTLGEAVHETAEERINDMLTDRAPKDSLKHDVASSIHNLQRGIYDKKNHDKQSVLSSAQCNYDDIYCRSKLNFDHPFVIKNAQQLSDFSSATSSALLSVSLPKTKRVVDESAMSLHMEGINEMSLPSNTSDSFGESRHCVEAPQKTSDEHQKDYYAGLHDVMHIDQHQLAAKKALNRIDVLAQSRNDLFAEREKKRIVSEMEQLRECTFHPNCTKPSRTISKARNDIRTDSAFQWLTLSPRQKVLRPLDEMMNGNKENCSQSTIQRLHLDGTARYDMREQARKALEAQKFLECTFKPKINPTSKTMISRIDYKPIHLRVYDLQRAKAEYIEQVRQQQDRNKYGSSLFVPTINSRSRQIALNKAFRQDTNEKLKPLHVTDRLAFDAYAIAQRKNATQEYFDLLNEQPFAPQISETSQKIVEQKPEFKMDFVARQHYFRSRDLERQETLEGLCDRDDSQGGKLTFKPDIGNADDVLRRLRPDRSTESSRQKLYRLAYNDHRKAELKRQRIQQAQHAQYTFKPEINPISKALGRSSTLEELSHPVLDIKSQLMPPHEPPTAGKSPASKAVMRQHFANKRFRSRIALEMEEASTAECTFRPRLVASKYRIGSARALKLEPRSKKMEWQSGHLLHQIEAERKSKADEIEAKRNIQELKELKECTFQPNLRKVRPRGKSSTKKIPPYYTSEEKPVIVRGLGRFLELRDLARKQHADQKEREKKVFALNTSYEPRIYTVPKPFKLSSTKQDRIRRRFKVREEIYAKERQECTFRPETVSSLSRRNMKNMLDY
ncbi:uncharacterized protein PHALS_03637 [Plasmopara halstedii]|uniref:Uncharacterized protein n=1 Tax=Plasmopara halstedii TaxID=4781 RepID=A0A0P1AZA4_PLAHL|nr:uncharacterized protein PHALS_03637 [Plasmopara halstedii]CEG46969.1 hypothetical protein PHALS_03637 [Plasmopara halstedii]|eukprot:XP_024583338.1 hypothetical protein PHALS_03637 [Plasmopara halstedii]